MTQLTVSDLSITPSKKSKTKPHKKNARLSKLVELQKRIVRLEERNQKKQQKIKAFSDEAVKIIGPSEEALCDKLEEYVEKLISFLPKKSIKGTKREALISWIEDEIENLESNPFRKKEVMHLKDAFTEYLLNEIKQEVEEQNIGEPTEWDIEQFRETLEDICDMQVWHDDDTLKSLMMDPSKIKGFIDALMQEKLLSEDEYDDEWDYDDDEEDDFEDIFSDEPSKKKKDIFKQEQDVNGALQSSQLNKLYKKLAIVLHPDKEACEQEKEKKHGLMQQLSKAKKQKDIYTLLQLAQTWLPNLELDLSKEALDSMIDSLKDKVEQLEEEFHDMERPDRLETMIWFRFGDNSKKAGVANLHQHVLNVSDRLDEIELEFARFRTVKDMNKVLAERLKPRWSPHDIDTDMLEKIFGIKPR